MREWRPFDVIGLVVIVSLSMLKVLGLDGVITWSLVGAVGAYMGFDVKGRSK